MSNSVLFKIDSEYTQWFYDKLVPGEHYLLVRSDLTNLLSKFYWAEYHQEECRQIAKSATRFAQEYLNQERIYAYFYHLLIEYAKLWKN